MTKTHLVIGDPHAHYQHDNRRATWLGRLILDLKPDTVINIGDQWDMPSLSSYDKGQRGFVGRTYRADIDAGLDFSERMFEPLRKAKRKLPRFVFHEGNHENRATKAIDFSPELDGTISFRDFDLDRNYSDIVRYTGKNTPGVISIDGVSYGHFMVSGVMGRPVGGEHPAYTLLSKQFESCTVAHSHLLDFCTRTNASGHQINALVAGCFIDYDLDWPGEAQKLWWRGLVICHNVEDGSYDPEFLSMKRLEGLYGDKT